MRDFLHRFRRAVRTIPRRVRWMLIAAVAFIVLFWIDRNLGGTIFFAVFGWLVIRELGRNQHLTRGAVQEDEDILDGMINPATDLMMIGGIDLGGNAFGCGHRHD